MSPWQNEDSDHTPHKPAANLTIHTPQGPQSEIAQSSTPLSGSTLPVDSVEPPAFLLQSATQTEQNFLAANSLQLPQFGRALREGSFYPSFHIAATNQSEQHIITSNTLQIPQTTRARGLSDVSVQVSSIGDRNNISPVSGLSSVSNSPTYSTPPRSSSPTRYPVLHQFDHQLAAESTFPASEQRRRFNIGQAVALWVREEYGMDAEDYLNGSAMVATQWAGKLPQPEKMVDPEKKSFAAHPSKAHKKAEIGRPKPYVVQSLSREHTHTFIWLHGTSTEGHGFGEEVLRFQFPKLSDTNIGSTSHENSLSENTDELTTLQRCFPTARFVFPSGSLKQVTVLGRKSNAWFDVHDFSDRSLGESCPIMRSGMSESIHYLKSLVQKESDILGNSVLDLSSPKSSTRPLDMRKKVILVGFSQGCAVGIITILSGLLKDPALGAFVGLSGWLPFISDICKETVSQFPAHSVPPPNPGLLRRRTVDCINNLLSLIPKCKDIERQELESQDLERAGLRRLEQERHEKLAELEGRDEELNDNIEEIERRNTPLTTSELDGMETERLKIWIQRKELKKEHETMAMELEKLEQNVLEARKKAEGMEMKDLVLDLNVPIWFAHGTDDQKVKTEWNEAMRETVEEIGMARVDGERYKGVGHELGKEEIRDMVIWLRRLPGLGLPATTDEVKEVSE